MHFFVKDEQVNGDGWRCMKMKCSLLILLPWTLRTTASAPPQAHSDISRIRHSINDRWLSYGSESEVHSRESLWLTWQKFEWSFKREMSSSEMIYTGHFMFLFRIWPIETQWEQLQPTLAWPVFMWLHPLSLSLSAVLHFTALRQTRSTSTPHAHCKAACVCFYIVVRIIKGKIFPAFS